MKRRFHIDGVTDRGSLKLSECGGNLRGAVSPLVHGKPLQPGTVIAEMTPSEGGHVEIEVNEADVEGMDVSGGPSKVVNDAYRSGWDRIFASDSGKAN